MHIVDNNFVSLNNMGSPNLFAKVVITKTEYKNIFPYYLETGESITCYINQDCFITKQETKLLGKLLISVLFPYFILMLGFQEAIQKILWLWTGKPVYWSSFSKNTADFNKIKTALEPQFSEIFANKKEGNKRSDTRFF